MTNEDGKKIRNELHKQASGRDKFVICPFGELGQFTKEVLNTEYGIDELLILDNYKTGNNIKTIKWLENNKLDSDVVVLLTAWEEKVRKELRDELIYYGILEEQIVDAMGSSSADIWKGYLRYRADVVGMDDSERIFSMRSHKVRFWLPLYDQDCIQKNIFQCDAYYEERLLTYVTKVFKSGAIGKRIDNGVVLDIGANIGNYSLYYALECNAGKVIAFEPVAETYCNLEKNIELNGLSDVVEIHNSGVGKTTSKAQLKFPLWNLNTGAAMLEENTEGDINLVAIDEMNLSHVDFMKIDVEGMECEVIKGALKTIEKYRPFVVLESWYDVNKPLEPWRNNDNIFDIIKMLSPLGYWWKQISETDYLFYLKE